MDKLVRLVDEHAPLRKRSVKGSSATWTVDELRPFKIAAQKIRVLFR